MKEKLAIVFIVLLTTVHACSLCGRPQPRLICEEYSTVRAVVVAELISSRHLSMEQTGDLGTDAHIYRLRILKVIRGRVAPEFEVFDSNDSARSALDWHKGTQYLLFVESRPWSKYLMIDGCGSSVEMKNASSALAAIERIQSGSTRTFIQGFLEEYDGANGGTAESVEVNVHGTSHNYKTVTNRHGAFKIFVPPGRYRVELSSPGKRFESYFIAYEDPEDINIPKGGCSLLAFEQTKK